MAHVFHVEFGINETTLTRALENGNYASAERLILDCVNPSYLDEGCYQRIPLNICLCGVDQDAERVTARNLYLARLLIERGANINHRVPVTFYGSEFLSPGKSCLELLADYYVDLTRRNGRFSQMLNEDYSGWSSAGDVVVGLNKDILQTAEDILENVLDLIFIVLSNGGDPNITDENRMTALHHTCMYSQDIRLLKLLCDNGADLNAEDSHGNTPLLALCDMATARLYDNSEDLSSCSEDMATVRRYDGSEDRSPCSQDMATARLYDNSENRSPCSKDMATARLYDGSEDLSPCSQDSASTVCGLSSVDSQFLDFLICIKDIDVNHQNSIGRTALFHCMVRGDVEGASKLLRAEVNPALRGSLWQTRKRKREVSPLLAVFAGWPVQRKMMWVDPHQCLTTAMQPFRHLVDAGYFSQPEIEEELAQLIDSLLPELSHMRQHQSRLIPLLFGGATCTLQQLCARTVFRHCLVESTRCLQLILPGAAFREGFQPWDLMGPGQRETYEEYMGLVVNGTVLGALVSLLGLPPLALHCLQMELLLQRLGLQLCRLSVEKPPPPGHRELLAAGSDYPPLQGFSSSDDDDDSSFSEGVGDSDLEYW